MSISNSPTFIRGWVGIFYIPFLLLNGLVFRIALLGGDTSHERWHLR